MKVTACRVLVENPSVGDGTITGRRLPRILLAFFLSGVFVFMTAAIDERELKEQLERIEEAEKADDWPMVIGLAHEVLMYHPKTIEMWEWAGKAASRLDIHMAAIKLLRRAGGHESTVRKLRSKMKKRLGTVVVRCSKCDRNTQVEARAMEMVNGNFSQGSKLSDQTVATDAASKFSPMQMSVVAAQLNDLMAQLSSQASTLEVEGTKQGWKIEISDIHTPKSGRTVSWQLDLRDLGYANPSGEVEIKPGKTRDIRVVLEKLPLIDLSNIGADESVQVDGSPTRREVIVVDPGEHQLIREREGFRWQREITVKGGETFVLDPQKEQWPSLRIQGFSSKERLWVNERPIDMRGGNEVKPAPGKFTIRVMRGGEELLSEELELAMGEKQERVLPGRLRLSLPPSAWLVDLDGERLEGTTHTTTKVDVAPGEHRVRIESPQFHAIEKSWIAKPGSDETWSVSVGDLKTTPSWHRYEESSHHQSISWWIVGGSAALATTAILSAVLYSVENGAAGEAYDDYHAGRLPSELDGPKERVRAAEEAASIWGNMGIGLGTASAAMAGWAVFRLITGPRAEEPTALHVEMDVDADSDAPPPSDDAERQDDIEENVEGQEVGLWQRPQWATEVTP